jgi:hypothetical protein
MSKNYYVYAYLREDGTPYYIGKGKGGRIHDKNHSVVVPKNKARRKILHENLTEDEAFSLEINLISEYGRKDLGTGILRNQTNGGDGASGWPEHRKKSKSKYTTEQNKKQAAEGKHPWQGEQGSKRATIRNKKNVVDGTNPFAGKLGSEMSKKVQRDRVEAGTHPFAGEKGSKHSTELNQKMLREGRHPSQNSEAIKKITEAAQRLANSGMNPGQLAAKNGTHPSQQKWQCPHCNKEGVGLSNASRWHFDNCKMKDKNG